MNIFGVIVAGRLVKTDFAIHKEGEYVIELPDVTNINHIVVFLTGLQPLPHGFGASIFISWPSTEKAIGSAEWNNLGFISNEKPSAIFRVGQHSNLLRTQTVFVGDQTLNTEGAKNAFLGIMLEPLNRIQNKGQIAAQSTAEKQQISVNDFAQKMLRNFVNYIQSFAVSLPKHDQMLTSVTTEMAEYVPTKAVTDWFNNFQRKLQMKPDFWRELPL
uniref:Hikeshi-like domain-containing protein n=1 Tax=Globodera rostochiensis TaxID=31243 RepID=A0A914GXW9_GLORO